MGLDELIRGLKYIALYLPWTELRKKAESILMQAVERLEAQQARIRELEEQQRWIPVGERSPEEITNRVNVLCKNGYRGFGHYEDRNGKRTWYNLENDRPFTDWDPDDYEVTHWMPLPELPEEAANESDT